MYKELYDKCILQKAKMLFVDKYELRGNFSHKVKHHILDEFATQKITELLINNVVFYAYGPDEINSKCSEDSIPEELVTLAKISFSERLAKRLAAKSDGLIGELMLDILIQQINPTSNKIFTRAKYVQLSDNSEIKGYDSAYFVHTKNDEIELWLGQSKAGDEYYCKKGICTDLNEKYLDKYFCNAVRYMVDRIDEGKKDEKLLFIIESINKILFEVQKVVSLNREQQRENSIFEILNVNSVKIKVPCLLLFTSEIYNNANSFDEKIKEKSEEIFKYFENKPYTITDKLNVEIIFIVFPIENVDAIRENISSFKKEALYD